MILTDCVIYHDALRSLLNLILTLSPTTLVHAAAVLTQLYLETRLVFLQFCVFETSSIN